MATKRFHVLPSRINNIGGVCLRFPETTCSALPVLNHHHRDAAGRPLGFGPRRPSQAEFSSRRQRGRRPSNLSRGAATRVKGDRCYSPITQSIIGSRHRGNMQACVNERFWLDNAGHEAGIRPGVHPFRQIGFSCRSSRLLLFFLPSPSQGYRQARGLAAGHLHPKARLLTSG